MAAIKVLIQKEDDASDLPLPTYMTSGSSGLDLYSADKKSVFLKPGERKLVSTGIRLSIPLGYEVQVRPRSGLAIKHGITLLNTPGTIDSDYRGLISVILINLGQETFEVQYGMRIAQMVVQQVIQVEFEQVPALDVTERSAGGFGHTGV